MKFALFPWANSIGYCFVKGPDTVWSASGHGAVAVPRRGGWVSRRRRGRSGQPRHGAHADVRAARSSSSRCPRSRACRGPRRRTRRATTGNSSCRVRRAGSSQSCASLSCGGPKASPARRYTSASIAARRSTTTRSSGCWRTAGGARIPSRRGTARRQDSICPACTHRWAGFRGRCRRAVRASAKEPGAPPRRGSGLEAPVRPARAVQDRDRASWRRIPHRGRTRPEGPHRGDSSP